MGQNPAHTKISRSSGSSGVFSKIWQLGFWSTNPYGLVTKPEKVPWSSRPSLKRPPAPQCRARTSDSWDSLEKRPAWSLPSHCDGRLARPDGLTMALSHRSSNFMAGWWWGWWWSVWRWWVMVMTTMTMPMTTTMTMTIIYYHHDSDYSYTSSRSCDWPTNGVGPFQHTTAPTGAHSPCKEAGIAGRCDRSYFHHLVWGQWCLIQPMRQITHSHRSSKHKLCLQRRSKNHAGTKIHCRQRTVHCAKAAQQLHQANSDAPRVLSDANSGQNWPDWARNI